MVYRVIFIVFMGSFGHPMNTNWGLLFSELNDCNTITEAKDALVFDDLSSIVIMEGGSKIFAAEH